MKNPEKWVPAEPEGWLQKIRPRRHLALLGGTVTFRDCVAVLPYLLNPRKLVGGEAIAQYEAAFARTVGVAHAMSFSSARVGFYGLLRALGVGAGDEVLLQVPTHVVVANAIRYSGATPVYVDCRPDSYNMDLEDAQRKITPRTRVLLIQHTFGIPAELDQALALARRHGLVPIEDCVHALGSTYAGKRVGSFGIAGFFSTEETKIISTTMGGMVVTDDPQLAARMRLFQKSCCPPGAGLAARYVLKLFMYCVLAHPYLHRYTRALYEFFGKRLPLPRPTSQEELQGLKPHRYEQLLSNAQAVVGLRQLRGLEQNVAHRTMIGRIYAETLGGLGFIPPAVPEKGEASLVRFPLQVPDRGAFNRMMAPYCVPGAWFASVLEEAVHPACGEYVTGSCPVAELVSRHLVNLPTHPRVTVADALQLVSVLERYRNEHVSCSVLWKGEGEEQTEGVEAGRRRGRSAAVGGGRSAGIAP